MVDFTMTGSQVIPLPPKTCQTCGHFATRHYAGACEGVSKPCSCNGFMWLGLRYRNGRDVDDGKEPIA